MFADDLTVWKTEPAVVTLATALTTINNTIAAWTTERDIVLAEDKCETILFTNYAKDPKAERHSQGHCHPREGRCSFFLAPIWTEGSLSTLTLTI